MLPGSSGWQVPRIEISGPPSDRQDMPHTVLTATDATSAMNQRFVRLIGCWTEHLLGDEDPENVVLRT